MNAVADSYTRKTLPQQKPLIVDFVLNNSTKQFVMLFFIYEQLRFHFWV